MPSSSASIEQGSYLDLKSVDCAVGLPNMIRPRSIKVVALILVVVAALATLLGWDLVYERRLLDPPKHGTLID